MLSLFSDDDHEHPVIARGSIEGKPSTFSPTLKKLLTYWRRTGTPERLPSRDDFKPEDVKDILPSVFMVDVDPDTGELRYRLVGTQVSAVSGRDLTGQPIDESTYGESATFVRALLEDVVRLRTPILARGDAKWLTSSEWRTLAVLLLPLSNDGKTVNIILGGINSDYRAEAQPESDQLLSLSQVEIIADPQITG